MNFCHTIAFKRDGYRVTVVVESQRPIAEIASAALGHTGAYRKCYLQLVHSELHLVLIDGSPHIRGPMLVELMRIVKKERIVDVERVISAATAADRTRASLTLTVGMEYDHHLLCTNTNARSDFFSLCVRSSSLYHACDRKLFQGRQQSCRVLKVNMSSRVGIIKNLVACAYPHRLADQVLLR